ncbi:MAG: hypothetical protein P4M00_06490 [Azospirillaceae bacterium]|nr:hypothetical protein [Azospirillaceae bacterium]
MIKILLILLMALIFGGAGLAGGWFLFRHNPVVTAEASPPPPPPAAPVVDSAPVFVKVGPLILPVIGKDRVDQVVTLVVALEVADDGVAAKIRAVMPRLEDACLQTLYGGFATGVLLDNGLVKVDEVKAKLTIAVQKLMGKDAIHDVLVQVVTQRPA